MGSKFSALKTLLIGTTFLIGATGTALADQRDSWYIGLEVGASFVNNTDTAANPFLVDDLFFVGKGFGQSELDFDTGWATFATVGYDFGDWRLEAEAGLRHNQFDLSGNTFPTSDEGPFFFPLSASGELKELTLMANVVYDIPLSEDLELSIGVGAGADRATLEVDPFSFNPGGKDEDWNFAYQGIASFNYKMSSRLDLTLNYRYLQVDDPNLKTPGFDGIAIDDDLQKQTVTVGLRYDFWTEETPPPTPTAALPPALPPTPPSEYLVFFEWNKCNLTGQANQVLDEAAMNAAQSKSVRIRIVGHTDASGSTAYNQKLSECRASAVRSNLIAKGIAEDRIQAAGKGESELLVQTDDGIKEPQNRRASITLSN
jgi:OmpA-OmpF porin, OOP family